MKTQRAMPSAEFKALASRIYREVAPVVYNGKAGTAVFIVDGEFKATQQLGEARWIMTDNPYDVHLMQIDSTGVAVVLIPT